MPEVIIVQRQKMHPVAQLRLAPVKNRAINKNVVLTVQRNALLAKTQKAIKKTRHN
jgi:hypothetical protein